MTVYFSDGSTMEVSDRLRSIRIPRPLRKLTVPFHMPQDLREKYSSEEITDLEVTIQTEQIREEGMHAAEHSFYDYDIVRTDKGFYVALLR